jgi:hypothetical protein
MAETESKTRSFLKPIIGGLVLVAALVGVIAFRTQLGTGLKKAGIKTGNTLVDWVPDHPAQTVAIVMLGLVAFGINWIAHIRGRLRAWIFAIVVEIGILVLFWNSLGIPSLNELFGLNIDGLTANEQLISGAVVIVLAGLVFWFLESREEWNKYRRRHNPDDN